MEKTIEQLLQLSKNPYFELSIEERQRLNDFLSEKSGQNSPLKKSGQDSERNIPATVINKNVVKKETGGIPTINNAVREDDKSEA